MQGQIKLISTYFAGVSSPHTKLVCLNSYGNNRPAIIINAFKRDIQTLCNTNEELVLCGDINARHGFWNCLRSNAAGNILYETINNHRNILLHYPTSPTYVPLKRNDNPSTLDLVLTNSHLLMGRVHNN